MTAAIEVDGVRFAYGPDVILDDVTFDVGEQEFVALAGPNGSGKSTLLRVILGLLPAERGEARVLGAPISGLRERWRIGYVPQRVRVVEGMPVSVAEAVAAGRLARRGWGRRLRRADAEAIEHALASVEVDDLANRRLFELSGGQLQRVMIAKALATEPDVLILDEPVAGVDAESQRRFREALLHLQREHGAAILLVSHEFGAVADHLDRVVVLQRGQVAFDGPPVDLVAAGVHLGLHAHDMPQWLEDSGWTAP